MRPDMRYPSTKPRNARRWNLPAPTEPAATPRAWFRGSFARKPTPHKMALPRSGKGPRTITRAPLTRLLPGQPFHQLFARRRKKLWIA